MSTSIRVSDETKEKLSRLKREDESWDEFLDRLANEGSRMNPGAWKGTGKAETARDAIKRSRESHETHETDLTTDLRYGVTRT